jgi:Zn-dependent peptidase ImmA (M78 family)
VIHQGSYGYDAQLGRETIGAYSDKRSTIYINAPLSFSPEYEHVLYHELFHALLDKATDSKEKRAMLSYEFEMTISKVLPKDSQLLKDLR